MALFAGIARKLASSGYGVFAMDYSGFGLSEGLHGYNPSFDGLVNDVIEHFSKIKGLAYAFPKLKIVPHKDNTEMAFRDLKKKEQVAYNIIAYKDTARLWTALECYRTTQEIEQRLEEVSLPLLILHGEADIVTDPSVSKALYETASSSDKKIKHYKGAYHSLIDGELDEVIIQVLEDIISWLDEHSPLISRLSL